MASMSFPYIQGMIYDFSSLDLGFDGKVQDWTEGLKEISFNEELTPGEVRGRRAHVIGTTRGEYKADGSFTFFFVQGQQLIEYLCDGEGNGWGEKYFTLTLTYEEGSLKNKVEWFGCRLKKADDSQSQGGDPLETKFDVFISMIARNGKYMVKKVKKF